MSLAQSEDREDQSCALRQLTLPVGGRQTGSVIQGLEQGRPGEALLRRVLEIKEGGEWRASLVTGLHLVVSWVGLPFVVYLTPLYLHH